MKSGFVGQGRGLALVALLALVLCIGSSADGAKPAEKNNKDEGGINPTSIVVLDDDLLFAVNYLGFEESAEEQIEAPTAQLFATGHGVTVAVLDGGFNLEHPSISGNLKKSGYDAIDDDSDTHDTGNGVDDNGDGQVDYGVGHGTFVAGMVLQAAPDATILPIRVRDDEGLGTNDVLIRGINYAVSERVDVMNLSLTNADTRSNGLRSALKAAARRGIVLVLSAGNDGNAWLNDIAYGADRIAVGAVDANDNIAPFSNYYLWHSGLMTFAPGVDLYGPTGRPDHDGMGFWSGTSFSAGFVSGAAALRRQLRPDDDPEEVIEALKGAVDPVYFSDDDEVPVPGVGRINLLKVVADDD